MYEGSICFFIQLALRKLLFSYPTTLSTFISKLTSLLNNPLISYRANCASIEMGEYEKPNEGNLV